MRSLQAFSLYLKHKYLQETQKQTSETLAKLLFCAGIFKQQNLLKRILG
jgi:hypothetical protein